MVAFAAALDALSELRTLHDALDEGGEAEVILFRFASNGGYGGHVVVLKTAAEGVGQEFFSHGAHEQFRPAHQSGLQIGGAGDRSAIGQGAGGIDLGIPVEFTPAADWVEMFEREAD